MLYRYTPRKFIDALELNGYKLTNLVNAGIDRGRFVPRYKEGTKKIKELSYDYKKRIHLKTIEKIAHTLVEFGFFQENDFNQIVICFQNDNFDALIPKDLL